MIMPKMNGRDCFFGIKKVNPNAKVILTSGFTLEKDLHDLKENGLRGFVRKPYRTAQLSHAVYEAMN